MRQRVSLLDNVATSSSTTLLLGVAALIGFLTASTEYWVIALWIAVAVMMLPVIRRHNLSQSNSPIACGLFLLMQGAMAPVALQPIESFALTATALAGMELLFECYMKPKDTTLIFSAMLLVGCGMVFNWTYAVMAVVFIIGIFQMRAFSMRGLVAMLLGLITGPLLLYGFQIVPISMPALPHPLILSAGNDADFHLIISAGATMIASIIFGGSCILTSYGYPAKARAFNGLIYCMTICAIVCLMADASHAYAYLGLLNICSAYHIGHFAVSHSRGWIAIVISIISITALYVWNVWI